MNIHIRADEKIEKLIKDDIYLKIWYNIRTSIIGGISMLSTLVQFCTKWIGTDPQWPILISILLVILVLAGPRKIITVRKIEKNKWTITFR